MAQKVKKLIIIDGNALLHRAWHALPPTLTTKTGEIVNAVYGFTMILLKVLKEFKPEYVAVTFDKAAPTFRHEAFAEYKAQRVKQPDELYNQIGRLKEVLEAFNIQYFEKDGFEADDLIGTIAEKKSVNRRDVLSVIVTGDLDTLQLVDDNTHVYTLKKGISDMIIYNEAAVKERFGLTPNQLNDYKALKGDPSDNIPGVKGIGEKTATELIQKFGQLENLIEKVKKDRHETKELKERIKRLIKEHEADAFLSKKLVTIVKNVPIDFDLEKCRFGLFDRQKVVKLFQGLEFKSLLSKIPTKEDLSPAAQAQLFGGLTPPKAKEEKSKYFLVDDEKKFSDFYKKLKKQKIICFDTETTGINPFNAKLLGISFSWQEKESFFVSVRSRQEVLWLEKIKKILEDEKIKKIGHNIKYDLEVLAGAGVEVKGTDFDTMVASYLLNPGSRQHSLDILAFREFGYEMAGLDSFLGAGKNRITVAQIPVQQLSDYSCGDADYTFRLYKKLMPELKEKTLWKLFEEIEMPLVPVLTKMETNGVKIDSDFLNEMSKKVGRQIKKLSSEIYKQAGQEFNINSPQQLKEILFEKLKIPTLEIRKIKTGLSTAASELEKLKGKHPIIDFIFEHRELAKLKSTYLDALPLLVNSQTKRVHTSFNQTVTATGRLSSSDPNLQNIPIRTEIGREIRKAFIAPKGYKILAADYSQIELRIVASVANDKAMLESFKKGEDIHSRTAAEIWGIEPSAVSAEMRRAAKAINFGVTYGMGAFGLAESAGISRQDAQKFIDKYFEIHQGIKEYIEKSKEFAHENSYVKTLLGRIRYLPEINSGVSMIRNSAERMAVNHPIQGTAADMIKIAMINIQNKFNQLKGNENGEIVKMILQVHDELVFEVNEEKIDVVSEIIKEEMANAFKLKVPVVVNISVGDNWGECK